MLFLTCFFLHDIYRRSQYLEIIAELKKCIETRHAGEGGFDWVSEIKDGKGKQCGCSWRLETERIG